MQRGNVTTPFGRRPVTLTLVRRQLAAREIAADKKADKWKVFRDIAEARPLLGLQDRSLAVLDALLSFYPETDLTEDGQLIVFPSNAQLSLRAHGIAGATLRRHIASLVDAGLIVRRDSANGKRFARKDRSGTVEDAFGFDLTPLLQRAEELAAMAQMVAADRLQFRRARENLTIARRDLRKLISAAMEEGAAGDWTYAEACYIEIVGDIPRNPTMDDVRTALDALATLRENILNLLIPLENEENKSSNADHHDRHIQNSKSESTHELEPRSEKEQGAKPAEPKRAEPSQLKAFPLGLVLRACPDMADYGPQGKIESWRDMMAAAVTVRSMLGISPSAFEAACDAMGPENAAAVVACILERGGHINSAGGYLRDLTARSRRGEFSLGPMLMALLRANDSPAKSA